MFGAEVAGEAGGNPLFAGGAGGRGDDSPLGPGSVKTGREMSSAANPMFGGDDAGDASNPLYGGGGGECPPGRRQQPIDTAVLGCMALLTQQDQAYCIHLREACHRSPHIPPA